MQLKQLTLKAFHWDFKLCAHGVELENSQAPVLISKQLCFQPQIPCVIPPRHNFGQQKVFKTPEYHSMTSKSRKSSRKDNPAAASLTVETMKALLKQLRETLPAKVLPWGSGFKTGLDMLDGGGTQSTHFLTQIFLRRCQSTPARARVSLFQRVC